MTVMLTISMAVVVWLMAMIVVVVMAALAAIVVTVTVGSGRVRRSTISIRATRIIYTSVRTQYLLECILS